MSTHLRARKKAAPSAKAQRAKRPAGHAKAAGPMKLAAAPKKAAAPLSRKTGGLTRKQYARLTGFSERAIAGWEAGEPVSEAARRRLVETERFRERLAQVVRAEEIPGWLDTPNDAFQGLKPVEVIERGEIDRLWNMIFYLESGVPT